MICCGVNNFNDLKSYITNYLRIFDKVSQNRLQDNEWENISTPRGQ